MHTGFGELKRPPGRSRRRREDNIKMDLKEIRWDWTGLIWLSIRTSGGKGRKTFGFRTMRWNFLTS